MGSSVKIISAQAASVKSAIIAPVSRRTDQWGSAHVFEPTRCRPVPQPAHYVHPGRSRMAGALAVSRSEEHTSELQSHSDLVCRLLLEKKKQKIKKQQHVHNKQQNKT